ncbi:unnamed protein product [Prunus armeniaca]
MEKDHQMGSTESSSHDNTIFIVEQLLGETQEEEACNPSNLENVGNQSLIDCLTGADLVFYDDVDPTTFDIGENPSNFENVGNQSFANCLTGVDLVFYDDVDLTTFDIGETKVVEVCNPTNIEDAGNQSLADTANVTDPIVNG